ncbi:MAG TPA: hypothetical protein VGY66_18495, partial [Gemmataceae bacterium]|nr:hypothetical protein [Gemmataceae bacterium]
RKTIMKKLLIVTTAVTVLAAISQAFASPSYEAEYDYDGWRAAESALAGKRFIPWEAAQALEPNGHTSTFGQIKSRGRK